MSKLRDTKERPIRLFPNTRFWGPCNPDEASDLVSDVLGDKDNEEALRLFAIGEIEANELSFRLQMSFEAHDERRRKEEREEAALSIGQYDDYEEHA